MDEYFKDHGGSETHNLQTTQHASRLGPRNLFAFMTPSSGATEFRAGGRPTPFPRGMVFGDMPHRQDVPFSPGPLQERERMSSPRPGMDMIPAWDYDRYMRSGESFFYPAAVQDTADLTFRIAAESAPLSWHESLMAPPSLDHVETAAAIAKFLQPAIPLWPQPLWANRRWTAMSAAAKRGMALDLSTASIPEVNGYVTKLYQWTLERVDEAMNGKWPEDKIVEFTLGEVFKAFTRFPGLHIWKNQDSDEWISYFMYIDNMEQAALAAMFIQGADSEFSGPVYRKVMNVMFPSVGPFFKVDNWRHAMFPVFYTFPKDLESEAKHRKLMLDNWKSSTDVAPAFTEEALNTSGQMPLLSSPAGVRRIMLATEDTMEATAIYVRMSALRRVRPIFLANFVKLCEVEGNDTLAADAKRRMQGWSLGVWKMDLWNKVKDTLRPEASIQPPSWRDQLEVLTNSSGGRRELGEASGGVTTSAKRSRSQAEQGFDWEAEARPQPRESWRPDRLAATPVEAPDNSPLFGYSRDWSHQQSPEQHWRGPSVSLSEEDPYKDLWKSVHIPDSIKSLLNAPYEIARGTSSSQYKIAAAKLFGPNEKLRISLSMQQTPHTLTDCLNSANLHFGKCGVLHRDAYEYMRQAVFEDRGTNSVYRTSVQRRESAAFQDAPDDVAAGSNEFWRMRLRQLQVHIVSYALGAVNGPQKMAEAMALRVAGNPYLRKSQRIFMIPSLMGEFCALVGDTGTFPDDLLRNIWRGIIQNSDRDQKDIPGEANVLITEYERILEKSRSEDRESEHETALQEIERVIRYLRLHYSEKIREVEAMVEQEERKSKSRLSSESKRVGWSTDTQHMEDRRNFRNNFLTGLQASRRPQQEISLARSISNSLRPGFEDDSDTAEDYQEFGQLISNSAAPPRTNSPRRAGPAQCNSCGLPGHFMRNCPVSYKHRDGPVQGMFDLHHQAVAAHMDCDAILDNIAAGRTLHSMREPKFRDHGINEIEKAREALRKGDKIILGEEPIAKFPEGFIPTMGQGGYPARRQPASSYSSTMVVQMNASAVEIEDVHAELKKHNNGNLIFIPLKMCGTGEATSVDPTWAATLAQVDTGSAINWIDRDYLLQLSWTGSTIKFDGLNIQPLAGAAVPVEYVKLTLAFEMIPFGAQRRL